MLSYILIMGSPSSWLQLAVLNLLLGEVDPPDGDTDRAPVDKLYENLMAAEVTFLKSTKSNCHFQSWQEKT